MLERGVRVRKVNQPKLSSEVLDALIADSDKRICRQVNIIEHAVIDVALILIPDILDNRLPSPLRKSRRSHFVVAC